MYSLVSAIARLKNGNAGWQSVDIENVPLNVLFTTYEHIYALLSNPFATDQVAFFVDQLREANSSNTITFNQFLVLNGQNALITLPKSAMNIVSDYVRYVDAFKAQYKVTVTAPNSPPDTNHPYGDKTWLVMNKPNMNKALFHKKCLVVVNGLIHRSTFDEYGIQVVDGMKSNFISGMNGLGILHFGKLGDLTILPITDDMVYKQHPNQKYSDHISIDTGVDLTGKTPMLVLGGYLHFLDKSTLKIISNTAIGVETRNIPLLDRFYESGRLIDLSSLGLQRTTANPNQVSVEDFFSDEVLLRYLKLSQSFIVLLDRDELYFEKTYLNKSVSLDRYRAHIKPDQPLFSGHGRIINYWSIKEHGIWAISATRGYRYNFVHNTVKYKNNLAVGGGRWPAQPGVNSQPFFLKIAGDIR